MADVSGGYDRERSDRHRSSRRSRSRSRSPRHHRHRDDRDRHRDSHRRDRDRGRDRDRDRDDRRRRRSRSRSPRRSRSRHRHGKRSSSRDRSVPRALMRARSKPSNFDVAPTPEQLAQQAQQAAAAAHGGGPHGHGGPHGGNSFAPPSHGGPPRGGFGGPPPPMGMGGHVQVDHTTRHARRLYVGGIGGAITEPEVMDFFNRAVTKALQSPLPVPSPPVISVYINRDRRFAFVEFVTIELATACMALDGLNFNGTTLRIRRPNDYRPDMLPPAGELPRLDVGSLQINATASNAGANFSEHRLFVGGIPYDMNEAQLRELLTSFGAIKDLQIIMDNGVPKGYAFAEYMDHGVTDQAIAGLNGMNIGQRALTVRRANPPGTTNRDMAAHGAGGGNNPNTMPLGIGGAGIGAGIGAGAAALNATNVLVLTGIISIDDFKDPEEFEDIKADIHDECKKFGNVKSMKVPTIGELAMGKVFVEYENAGDAAAASVSLGGRKFGDSVVSTQFMDAAKYAAGNLA